MAFNPQNISTLLREDTQSLPFPLCTRGLVHREIMWIPDDGGHPGLEHSLMQSVMHACTRSHMLRICLGQGQAK